MVFTSLNIILQKVLPQLICFVGLLLRIWNIKLFKQKVILAYTIGHRSPRGCSTSVLQWRAFDRWPCVPPVVHWYRDHQTIVYNLSVHDQYWLYYYLSSIFPGLNLTDDNNIISIYYNNIVNIKVGRSQYYTCISDVQCEHLLFYYIF